MHYYFYYDNNGQKQGPYSCVQLRNLSKEGKITPETLVEIDEEKSYPASKVKGLAFSETAQPETPPPAKPNPFTAPPPVPDNPFVGAPPVPDNPFIAQMPVSILPNSNDVPVTGKKLHVLQTIITCIVLLLIFGGAGWGAVYYIFSLSSEDKEFVDNWQAEYGDIINGVDEEGKTAFHHAVLSERLALLKYIERLAFVKSLIFQGGDVHAKNKENGATPLHLAAEKNNDIEVIEYLISREHVNATDKDGDTPLHRAAAFNNNVGVIVYLVSRGADVHAKNEKNGTTPFHLAVEKNENIEVVEYFISHGADVRIKNEKSGASPLHLAAANNNVDVVQYLVSKGADVHTKNEKNGATPLHLAAEKNKNIEVIRYLVSQGADVHTKNEKNGATPLHLAAEKNKNIEVIRYLVSQGADVVDTKDKQGRTPLDLAKVVNNREAVEYLSSIKSESERVTVRQQAQTEVEKFVGIAESAAEEAVNAETKVRVADANNDVKAAVIAVEEAAEAAKKARDAAEEAKNAAQGYAFTEMVRRATNADARAAAAENSAREIVQKTKEKDPLTEVAIPANVPQALVFNANEMAQIRNYISAYGFVEIDMPQCVNETIMGHARHVNAAIRGRIPVPDVIMKNDGDKTLLHMAAGDGNILVVKYLLSNNANVDIQAAFGQTPLHRVAVEGRFLVAKFLIANGANVGLQDKDFKIPFDKADVNDVDLRNLLTPAGAIRFHQAPEARIYVVPKNLPPK